MHISLQNGENAKRPKYQQYFAHDKSSTSGDGLDPPKELYEPTKAEHIRDLGDVCVDAVCSLVTLADAEILFSSSASNVTKTTTQRMKKVGAEKISAKKVLLAIKLAIG